MPLYFVAIVVPQEINRRVLQWKNYMLEKFGCRVALRSPGHITLVPPFNMSGERETELLEVLHHCSEKIPAFDIGLKDFSSFKPRVIFVNVTVNQHLSVAKSMVEECLHEAGYPIKKDTRPFHPHITIANRDLERRDYKAAWEHFLEVRYEASFRADNISLLRSEKEGWKVVGAAPVT